MARGPNLFRQTDITRALKGVRAAGVAVGRVEISREGRIVVFAPGTEPAHENDLDKWLQRHDARPT